MDSPRQPLMEQAISQMRQLPEAHQEAIAWIILQEIESERRWDELFARPESAIVLKRMAEEALADFQAGRTEELDPDNL